MLSFRNGSAPRFLFFVWFLCVESFAKLKHLIMAEMRVYVRLSAWIHRGNSWSISARGFLGSDITV